MDFPRADISVGIVWINMLAGDTQEAARRSAIIVADPRVRHFYDPDRQAGKAIAEVLGWKGHIAWDIYLFYAQDAVWGHLPPEPGTYMHQLRDGWATQAHFRRGDALVEALQTTMLRTTKLEDRCNMWAVSRRYGPF